MQLLVEKDESEDEISYRMRPESIAGTNGILGRARPGPNPRRRLPGLPLLA